MITNQADIAEFLDRLGHEVAVEATKPIDSCLPGRRMIWPYDLTEPVEQIAELAADYNRIFVNLNPFKEYVLAGRPPSSVGPRATMIARRTRLLVDIDGHGTPLEEAERQKERIKEYLGWPVLIETYSGNGYGLIYPIDLPNDQDSSNQIKQFLKGLKSDFPCVDTSVFTVNRYTRVAGTFNAREGERVLTRILN